MPYSVSCQYIDAILINFQLPLSKWKPATLSSYSCCEVSTSPAKRPTPSSTPRTMASPALQLAHQENQGTETAAQASSVVDPGVKASSTWEIKRLHRHAVSSGNVVSLVYDSSGDKSDDASTVSERSSLLVRSRVTTVDISIHSHRGHSWSTIQDLTQSPSRWTQALHTLTC
ncbi:hypothetical protein DPMN_009961 [Dreissena polymorpha]|uniref:Uncharacterized protein n=1 Tax=Dreissena polymorpha TaxID=45954 RepID=A0A9D4MXX9_DREPO|nr:hypothetical protein DPMN_009961 [Dreissena polymorpha]